MKSTSAIKAKFSRLNMKSSYTKLWTEMSEKETAIVAKNIHLRPEEAIIFCYFPNTLYWWALTNFRLVLNDSDEINFFYLSEIENVSISEMFEGVTKKQDCTNLDLHLASRNIKLKVEENTWHAIYNILKFSIN